eukprot:CAMPEP_0182861314 /NCGR_PEP_ID=MMETSP0034_2-20130328/5424_1 /TAXON_ID=156128 /ORGANISM="Nephroselmis pyriformis, Strain CCMP717" /LENGTH=447 /DNA_ID=CAMNT_0024993229 /DNA_START=223 /DNA_END=1563 /DNA_ORIENTATION=-
MVNEIDALREDNALLQEDVADMRNHIAELESQIDGDADVIERLEKDLDAANRAKRSGGGGGDAALQAEVESLRAKLAEAEEEIQGQTQLAKVLGTQIEAESKSAQEARERLDVKERALQAALNEAKGGDKDLAKRLKVMAARAAELEMDREKLLEELDHAHDQLQGIGNGQGDTERLALAAIKSKDQELAAARAAQQRLAAQVQQAMAGITDRESAIDEWESRVNELTESEEALAAELDEAQARLAELEEEKEEWATRAVNAEKNSSANGEQASEVRKLTDDLAEQLSDRERDIDRLEAALARAQFDAETAPPAEDKEMVARCADLERRLEEATGALEAAERAREEAVRDAAGKGDMIAVLSKQVDAESESAEEWRRRLKKKEEEMAGARGGTPMASPADPAMRQKLVEAEEALDDAEERIKAMEAASSDAQRVMREEALRAEGEIK